MTDLLTSNSSALAPEMPYPTIRGVVRHKRLVTALGTAAIVALGFWLGYRTGLTEIYAIAIIAGAAAYFSLQAAIEVVELVADTLMPR